MCAKPTLSYPLEANGIPEITMRQFIRYDVDIPIEITLKNDQGGKTERVKDISIGGLCVSMTDCPALGSQLLIRIPYLDPPFQTGVEVAWCLDKGDHYDVGLRLLDPNDAFRVRMVEQVCHIEHYRNEISAREGRRLTSREAAVEWISKYSASFPDLGHGHSNIRRFIRHPTDVRIETTLLQDGQVYVGDAHDIGLGGLRITLPLCPKMGSDITIKVLYVEPPFEARGQVVWCSPRDDRYDVGIELTSWQEDGWSRVVEQICEIERYRQQLQAQNAHELSIEEAAKQWYARNPMTS